MKIYYDNQAVNEIEYQIESGNPSRALELANKYMEDYPYDLSAPFFRARALANLGKRDEALEICNTAIEYDFHDVKATILSLTWYGNTLYDLGMYDEATREFKKAIAKENDNTDHLSLKARVGLVNIYIKQFKYEEALKVIKEAEQKGKDVLATKKAYIYMMQNKFRDAIKILKKIKDLPNAHAEQFVAMVYGRCYYSLNEYEEAISYFKKALTFKNTVYYKSCYYLSSVYCTINRLEDALNYATQLESNPEFRDDECKAKFKVYLKMGYLDRLIGLIEQTESPHFKNYLYACYYYAVKNYSKAIKYSTHVLNDDRVGLFRNALEIYILSYLKLGEYDMAKYMVNMCYDDLNKMFVNQVMAYIAGKDDSVTDKIPKMYNCSQLVSYDRNKAINHVISHHLLDINLTSLKSEETIRNIFDESEELIKNRVGFATGIFDKYVMPYSNIGTDQNGNCNSLVIITLPDSTDVITLYPLSGGDVYDCNEDDRMPKILHRPTQVEKFYNRYGFK